MIEQAQTSDDPLFGTYELGAAFDEMFREPGRVRSHYEALVRMLRDLPPTELNRRKQAADLAFLNQGITFTVYGDQGGTERIFPFDLLPRILTGDEWDVIERGLEQRIIALNHFITDVYSQGRILRDGIVPRELVLGNPYYVPEMRGVPIPGDVPVAVAGIDLIRQTDGSYAVLEDNLRVPSGVSYMLGNRTVSKQVFPRLFANYGVRPVADYPIELLKSLRALAPDGIDQVTIAVLTPGVFNSAYYEHAFLAQAMGVSLVEGRDLLVHDEKVYMRTTGGLHRVHVIYRRVDDDFLDPLAFRADSVLGVPGLFNAYRAGNVGLANAIGTGVADDKALYAYVPAIIKYYLDQDPILQNIQTFLCREPKQAQHVLDNLDKLVVKAVGQSGGYGMLIGPHATDAVRQEFADKIKADPANYIAQPTIQLSQVPVMVGDRIEGRHVDLRPYVLTGKRVRIVPGGLTRVALKKGSLVVNSSQGGGSKDTWVLEE